MAIAMALTLVPTLFFAATMALMLDGAGGPIFPVACAMVLAGFILVTLLRVARSMESDDLGADDDLGANNDLSTDDGVVVDIVTDDDLDHDTDHHAPMAA